MNKSQDNPITYQEYRDGLDELENSDGWRISRKIEHLGASFYIFKSNYDELIQRIECFKRPEAILLWDVRNDDQLERFLKEVTRLLHNFVAAALTLVEHTRIIAREMYKDTEFWKEYNLQITNRFALNPLVQFVQGLRNYILHRDLPLTSASLSSTHEASLKINISKLRTWRRWETVARDYIQAANDDEKIEDIVKAYTSSILDFYNWFYERQLDLHKEAFREAEGLRQRLVNSSWHWKIK
jgi:hypothetical protein